jgi:hypothetical protein
MTFSEGKTAPNIGDCDLCKPNNHQITALMSSLKANESAGSQNFTA